MNIAYAFNGQGGESFSLFFPLLILVVFGLWTASVARKKNRNSIAWFLAGAVIHIVALILVYNLPEKIVPGRTKRCVQCLEVSDINLDYCRNCGAKFIEEVFWQDYEGRGH